MGAVQSEEDVINGGRHATHKAGKYLALDCEMVGKGPPPHADDLLARVSIVNFLGEQIYDSYVQPVSGSKVEDYRTHVSGIRRQHLQPDTARPFKQVQQDVFDLLQGKILVGHAVFNDLSVKIVVTYLSSDLLTLHSQWVQHRHPYEDVRDTSLYYPLRKSIGVEREGEYTGLKKLYFKAFEEEIQKDIHCPVRRPYCASDAIADAFLLVPR